MSDRLDAVVIGAGANGLATATRLAAAGRKVLVVERRALLGGLAAGEEFAPGYRTVGILHDNSGLTPRVVAKLGLKRHGLELRSAAPDLLVAEPGGPGLLLSHDEDAAAAEIGARAPADGASYRRYRAFVTRLAPLVRRLLEGPPPDLTGNGAGNLMRLGLSALALRRLGKRDMMEVLRIGPMCVADWLAEWFESDLLRGGLAAPALQATFAGPWSPGTNLNLLLAECRDTVTVRGGPAALAVALEKAAAAAGATVLTGDGVATVDLDGDRTTGVTLTSGRAIEAPVVAASCDPKHLFLDLLPSGLLPQRLEHDVLHFRTRGTTAKIHLAVSAYPELAGRSQTRPERLRLGGGIDDLERAFDAVKYRRMSERPLLDVSVPTVDAPELAPPGHHVLSILVHYAPYELEGGWTDGAREELLRRTLAVLSEAAPGVEELIVAHEVLSPTDLHERYGPTGGHLHHGEHALDQLAVRPSSQCPGYATPFAGLYLCGSGSHPGGGVHCAPGLLAARRILKDS